MGSIEILVPVAVTRVRERPLADRPASLAGRRLGLLDNGKANAGLLLDTVRAGLNGRWPGVDVIEEQKGATVGAPEPVMSRLRTCDAVVLAIAD